ncbi:hypothetical protein ABZ738_07830 [Micromonospora sp. NPDC047793]|uniref:hypothetical protein n=1 Tax=Micromonospora sp. NPDC047793 TaxID=3154342 RepID=UPI0033D6CBF2
MTRTRWTALIAVAALATVAGCSDGAESELPVRSAPLPAEVRGLGAAVLAVPVADERRSDLVGLLAVDRFGDDVAGVTPVRRHVDLALGDPRFPTVARGLAEDRRDALLVGGRLRDVTLPEHTYAREVTGVAAGLSITGSRCLTVTGEGAIAQPSVEASCTAAELGGVMWQDRPRTGYGGIDLTTGAASPPVTLPSYPIAASADGRYLAALSKDRPRRLVVADTSNGRSRPTVELGGGTVQGAMTEGGFAVLHLVDRQRAVSVVAPDGAVRTLLSPVGEVAFAPDGSRAVVVDTRSDSKRLAVLDLSSGAVTPVADLPPMTGSVTATVSGDTALVVDVPFGPDSGEPTPRPTRAWSVRLAEATATPQPNPPAASAVLVRKTDTPPAVASTVSAVMFQPGGETLTLTPDGTVTTAPPGATPTASLGGGAVLHTLVDSDGEERADRVLVTDGSGGATEVSTGAGDDQRVDRVILTPDGGHLLFSLRPTRPRGQPSDLDAVVVARRDGSGEPVVVYRGAVLAGLGVEQTSTP